MSQQVVDHVPSAPQSSSLREEPADRPPDVRLRPEDVEAIAERVVEHLAERDGRRVTLGLATAAEVAKLYGVTPSWVYANKKRLGAVRLGDGPKARLRFDLERVEDELRIRANSHPRRRPRARRGRPRRTALPPGVDLLRGRGSR